ncbi:MAG: GNAT family N-acetyltransferase [Sphingobacteriaceae bacterium]|nr:GNAT family N-acetyltransferase [Sphingobacteriaceae bacterium]
MIQYLDWDSSFFEKKIGKLTVDEDVDALDIESINEGNFDIVYIFSRKPICVEAALVDVKITFIKAVDIFAESINVVDFNPLKHSYEQLVNLAFVSGHESRFLKDPNFGIDHFKKLYKKWVDNAISDENTIIKVYEENKSIMGFAICSLKRDENKIGLIAVDAGFQGRGIGSLLVKSIENAIEPGELLYVATQESNTLACRFYENLGFAHYSKVNIYHYAKHSL